MAKRKHSNSSRGSFGNESKKDSNSAHFKSDERSSDKKSSVTLKSTDKELCLVMETMGISYDVDSIVAQSSDEKVRLQGLLGRYKAILKDQRKYSNVENIDNDYKSES